jgi:hypothetical protein
MKEKLPRYEKVSHLHAMNRDNSSRDTTRAIPDYYDPNLEQNIGPAAYPDKVNPSIRAVLI